MSGCVGWWRHPRTPVPKRDSGGSRPHATRRSDSHPARSRLFACPLEIETYETTLPDSSTHLRSSLDPVSAVAALNLALRRSHWNQGLAQFSISKERLSVSNHRKVTDMTLGRLFLRRVSYRSSRLAPVEAAELAEPLRRNLLRYMRRPGWDRGLDSP